MMPKNAPPTHPGEVLLEEFLKPLEMSQAEAARRMKMPTNRVNEFVKGKRGMTPRTALRLATLCDTTPNSWMNLQVNRDLYFAAKAERKRRTA